MDGRHNRERKRTGTKEIDHPLTERVEKNISFGQQRRQKGKTGQKRKKEDSSVSEQGPEEKTLQGITHNKSRGRHSQKGNQCKDTGPDGIKKNPKDTYPSGYLRK